MTALRGFCTEISFRKTCCLKIGITAGPFLLDWECARIGDPAYDLAIVTRGIRKPLGVPDGLHRLVQFYNEVAEHKISPSAVVVHEALLHLNWLAEAAEARARNDFGGHGPEHYADLLGGILRRARAGQ